MEVTLHTFDTDARKRGCSTPRAGLYTPGKKIRFPFDRRLGGPLWMCLDSHASTEFRTPDRPAPNDLYQIRCPGRLSPGVILLFDVITSLASVC
jgi:hypothetical protein